jgi:DNA-binding NtrC family response regulator
MRSSEARKQRVALVAEDASIRSTLAEYLEQAGFDVHAYDELAVPSAYTALVLIDEHDNSERLLTDVRSWMRLAKTQRVVVVTSKPGALKDLALSHGERLHILPAPAFGWDLVDALRAIAPSNPRGA